MVELVIGPEKHNSYQVARIFLRKYRDNTRNISTTVDLKHHITASFVYRDLQELQDIIQEIKSIPYVKDCSVRC